MNFYEIKKIFLANWIDFESLESTYLLLATVHMKGWKL